MSDLGQVALWVVLIVAALVVLSILAVVGAVVFGVAKSVAVESAAVFRTQFAAAQAKRSATVKTEKAARRAGGDR